MNGVPGMDCAKAVGDHAACVCADQGGYKTGDEFVRRWGAPVFGYLFQVAKCMVE